MGMGFSEVKPHTTPALLNKNKISVVVAEMSNF